MLHSSGLLTVILLMLAGIFGWALTKLPDKYVFVIIVLVLILLIIYLAG
jgi:hypothetical protein